MINILVIQSDDHNIADRKVTQPFINNKSLQYAEFCCLADKQNIEEKLQDMKVNGNPNFILVYGHGNIDRNGDYYVLGHDKNEYGERIGISSKELFTVIAEKLGTQTDVFLATCHAGGALQDIDILPNGSQVAADCSKTQPGYKAANFEFRKMLRESTEQPTAYTMLLTYLSAIARTESNHRDDPQIGISGQENYISCEELLKEHRAKPIEYIDRLGKNVKTFINHSWFDTDKRFEAMQMCLRSRFGSQLTLDNYKPFVRQPLTPLAGESIKPIADTVTSLAEQRPSAHPSKVLPNINITPNVTSVPSDTITKNNDQPPQDDYSSR